MLAYLAKRILIAIPVLVSVIFIIFMIMNVLPGNPVEVMMREKANPAVIERVSREMGLYDPVMVRFFRYLKNAVKGDFGMSYKLNRDVGTMIKNAFPNTVRLAVAALMVAWIIGVPAGIISAVKKYSALDNIFMTFSLIGVSVPVFWTALLLQLVFGYYLKILPINGYTTWKHMILPAIALGWGSAGSVARLTRSNLLEVMRNDYIRTARAKGLMETLVVARHALKNSMLPVVTIMALQISSLLSGAVITESVFGIPGVGRLTVDAINSRDMPLLQGSVMFCTVIVILGNLAADMTYSFIDPRIRVK
jgi:peptide/nickel transport system permease protein